MSDESSSSKGIELIFHVDINSDKFRREALLAALAAGIEKFTRNSSSSRRLRFAYRSISTVIPSLADSERVRTIVAITGQSGEIPGC